MADKTKAEQKHEEHLESIDSDKQQELVDERYGNDRSEEDNPNAEIVERGNAYNTINEDHSAQKDMGAFVRESREDVIGVPIVSRGGVDTNPDVDSGPYGHIVDEYLDDNGDDDYDSEDDDDEGDYS